MLEFAEEIVQVGYGIADPTLMPLVEKGSQEEVKSGMLREEEKDTILSSTARLTADAPFQALSDGQYIYIFRQSLGQLGQLSATVNGSTTSLSLESGLTRNLPQGSLLQVGLTMTKVRVRQDTLSGATSIPIESVTLNVNQGTPIFDGPMVFAMQKGGASAKEYIEIGRLEQDIDDSSPTTTLTLKEGVSHSLPNEAILRIGNTSLTVSGSVASGEKQITIQSATLAANQGQQVEFKDPNRFVTDQNGNIVPVVNDTLLVDRFVLAGTTLKRKMEVRYKRSRNKYRSQGTKDSLGAKDLNQQPFYEPTQELDFVRNLRHGRFTALLLPTQIPEIKRWQLFAHNSKTGLIDSFNVERSSDGLFNTRGTQFYTSFHPEHRKDVFERQPGPDPFDNTKQLIPIVSKEGYAELALEFDGTGDYVQVDLPGAWNSDHFTLELWVKATETQQSAGTSVFSTQSGSGSFQIDSDGGGNYRFMGTPASTTIGGIETNWQHLAITYDGSMVKTYLNGIFKHSCAQSTFSFSEYRFGINRGKNLLFQGQIDEVRIWNRTRSQTEISEDMHHRLVGNELGLLDYWRFDAGSGTTVYLLSAEGSHHNLRFGVR